MHPFSPMARHLALSFVLSLAWALPGLSDVITRGPYLQQSTSSSIIIRWRTDVASDSQVQYGPSVGSLTSVVTDSNSTTEHEIKLTGLSANTKYFYNVGSTSLVLAGDATYFFVTHPTIGTAKNTRIWVIGDAGFGNAAQARVRDAYKTFTGSQHTDLWLQLGDNCYQITRNSVTYIDGSDGSFQYGCMEPYAEMFRKSVCWPTIGNHDTKVDPTPRNPSPTIPYYQIFNLPKNAEAGGVPSGTEDYYSFDYGNIHFICLDSQTESLSQTGPMVTWLKSDISSTTAKWIIAYWHHPVYTKGSSDSDQVYELRQAFAKILEDNGIDLVLTGHAHSYERSYFLDGHYGMSSTFNPATHIKVPGNGRVDGTGAYTKNPGPHNGAVYVVAGSSGDIISGPLNHPANFYSAAILGSMVIDINGNQLDAKFLNDTGVIKDYFTIIKGSGGTPVLTTITISPSPATVAPGGTQTFTAVAKDQSGIPMSPQPSFTWTFSGSGANGSINSSGVFTAGSTEGGPFTITAAAGGKSGTAQVNIASSTTVTFQDGVNGYTGTIDTTMDETSTRTDGEGTTVRLNVDFETGVENRQALVRWDLASIPTNSTITSATITLTTVRANSVGATETLALGKITSSWNESIKWSNGLPTSVPTGISLPLPSSAMPTNSFVIAGMKDVVQDWVRNPTQNFGVILNTGAKINYDFASRESTTVAYHPKITITYAAATTNPDSDGDGLPDAWESANFGSLAQNDTGDFDGDGLSNIAEFSAGTSPVNRSSNLAITSENMSGSSFVVTWQSVSGKQYKIESSTTLTGWTEVGTHTATGSTSTWTDTAASGIRKFYRVKLP